MDFGENFILEVINYLIMSGIALTIIMIMWNGFNLLNSRGDPSAFSRTKQKIMNTLLGLGVLLISFILLTTINPDLVKLDFSFEGVKVNNVTLFERKDPTETIKEYAFEEIPIGSILESLLAETTLMNPEEEEEGSILRNILCYEYETRMYDENDENIKKNIIIGDTVDQNGDGEIDEKDVLLGEDIFYCMSLLGNAYIAKIEYHLATLIDELDQLMKECSCTNCYTGRFVNQDYEYNYGTWSDTCESTTPMGKACTYTCYQPYSYCPQCCGGVNGCASAESRRGTGVKNDIITKIVKYIDEQPEKGVLYEFTQYKYDPCHNRLAIKCKQQEINQLITGEEPDAICYAKEAGGYINEDAPKSPIALTLNEAMERLDGYKDFYEDRLEHLIEAKIKMKTPWGERITLAEYNKIENEAVNFKVEKIPFKEYDISRYCRNFNSKGTTDTGTCKKAWGERQYFYDGDGATFYYSKDYNNYKLKNTYVLSNKKQCSIFEGDIEKGSYAGVIPIGEAVEDAIFWGEQVLKRVEKIQEIAGPGGYLEEEVSKLYKLSDDCSCDNCRSGNYGFLWSTCYYRSANYCAQNHYYRFNYCRLCVPSALKGDEMVTQPANQGSTRCYPHEYSYFESRDDHWVCPYGDFCSIVKNIYWEEGEDLTTVCFEDVEDPEGSEKSAEEQLLRAEKLSKTGYLERFKGYFAVLIELGGMNIQKPNYPDILPSSKLIEQICDEDLRDSLDSTFKPDSSIDDLNLYCPPDYNYTGEKAIYFCPNGEEGKKYWYCPIMPKHQEYCFGDLIEEETDPDLKDLIDYAKDLNSSTPVGDGPGEAPEEAHKELLEAIGIAQDYFNTHIIPEELMTDEQKEELENVKKDLSLAIDKFENIIGDREYLNEEVETGLFNTIKNWWDGLFGKKENNISHIKFYSLGSKTEEEESVSCDPSLSVEVENRFDILEKLTISRKRMTGCTKGFSGPYKESLSEVSEVFSCLEGLNQTGLVILPEFPYPRISSGETPYINCFPYNSDLLEEDQREMCFYNPLREGSDGCLEITKELMDNYYCCE